VSKDKTHSSKTSADSILVAFDYQYYYFLWKLLCLRPGESVGLEVKDDVHTELDNNEQVYFQVKHTIKKKIDKTPITLTESDSDLWKTLSNWSKIVSDSKDGRGEKLDQLKFIEKTSFILASNKSSSELNSILKAISDYQEGAMKFEDFKKKIEEFSNSSKSETIKSYINDVLSLTEEVLENYLKKIFFELNVDDIIFKCKEAIRADKIVDSKIDQVFSGLDSSIREDNFVKIRNGYKINVSFDDFYLRYRRHYDLARNGVLTISEYESALPDKLHKQIFIEQLVEINDVSIDDFEEIARLTVFKLKLKSNINIWLQQGEITSNEISDFKKDAVEQWRNKYKSSYRGVTDEKDYNNTALKVLDSIREKNLILCQQPMDTSMSNGAFYDLSDSPVIGWRKDWEKYKK